MEVVVMISFVGTMVLLVTHAVDYAVEATRRPVWAVRGALRNESARVREAGMRLDVVEQYDRAA